MDDRVEAVLQEYEQRAQRESDLIDGMSGAEMMQRRDDFLLPVGRGTGTMLDVLIREMPARTVLEIGSSYGYSTVWLARAAKHVGGYVVSLEMHQHKIDFAQQMLERAGLGEYVRFVAGDARASLDRAGRVVRPRAARPLEGHVHPLLRHGDSAAEPGRHHRRRQHALSGSHAAAGRPVSRARPHPTRHGFGAAAGGQRHRGRRDSIRYGRRRE